MKMASLAHEKSTTYEQLPIFMLSDAQEALGACGKTISLFDGGRGCDARGARVNQKGGLKNGTRRNQFGLVR